MEIVWFLVFYITSSVVYGIISVQLGRVVLPSQPSPGMCPPRSSVKPASAFIYHYTGETSVRVEPQVQHQTLLRLTLSLLLLTHLHWGDYALHVHPDAFLDPAPTTPR